MSKQAIHCLKQLVKKAEAQPERKRDVLLKRQGFTIDSHDPYPFRSADVIRGFHAYLSVFEEKGFISLEWEKHCDGTSLQRVRLHDARGVAEQIGYKYLPDRVELIEKELQWPPIGHWLNTYVEEILEAWRHGKRKYGLTIDQYSRLSILIEAVLAIETLPESTILDYRQFGARHLGDSKSVLLIITALGQIYRDKLAMPDLSYEDILSELNLVKMLHPLLISGPVTFHVRNQEINAAIRPYLGVPGDLLGKYSLSKTPRYIITIENLSSFLEYTSYIEDNAIVLYTGGYPTRRFQRFYQSLFSRTEIPTFHWGDSDPHGFQILKTLQGLAGDIIVSPHNMEYQTGGLFNVDQLRHIERLMPVNPPTDKILSGYLKTGLGQAEQEILAACTPVG